MENLKGEGLCVRCRTSWCLFCIVLVSFEAASVWLKIMARSGSDLQTFLPNTWLVARRTAVIHVLVVDVMANFASLSKLWLDDSAGPLVTHFSLP